MQLLETNAARVRELKAAIDSTFSKRSQDEASFAVWKEACRVFHESYDALAFPGGYERALDLLKSGNLETAETALLFCEMRPYFYRSGYIRSKLLRMLKHIDLPATLAVRLQRVLEEAHRRKVESRQRVNDYWAPRAKKRSEESI